MADAPVTDRIPPQRYLYGPGPSPVHPSVAAAMGKPLLGHLDPAYLAIMDELQSLLRGAFGTENTLTFPLPGTGSSGMEAAMVNLLEPGDTAVIGVAGYFGERLVDVARRQGADVVRVDAAWGQIIEPERFVAAVHANPRARLAAIVQGETSAGVLQPIQEIAAAVRQTDTLLVVDAVTSFGGTELPVDEWGIDLVYSCSQKCLGCPPGLSPLTAGPRVQERLNSRETPVANFYLDLTLLGNYWGPSRAYHHTAPAPFIYALHEGLRLAHEEGLPARYERHRRVAALLYDGLASLGLTLFADPQHRLPMLTTVNIPDGIDDAALRATLRDGHNIEIGGGIGPLVGTIWRLGTMGHGAAPETVERLLGALGSAMEAQGRVQSPKSKVQS